MLYPEPPLQPQSSQRSPVVKPSLILFLTGGLIIYFRDKSCLTGTPSTFLCYPVNLADIHTFLPPSFSGRAHLSPQLKHGLRRNWPQVIFSLQPLACYQALPISICLGFPTRQKLSSCPSGHSSASSLLFHSLTFCKAATYYSACTYLQSAQQVSVWKWLSLSYQHPPRCKILQTLFFFLDYWYVSS